MTLDICGVFYHCYKHRDLTAAVLRHFRKHYPAATVHLISDGGLDFSDISTEFGCRYWHEENIGQQCLRKEYPKTCKENMHKWIDRVRRCCVESEEKWMLVLEDDVLVRGKAEVPVYAMAGANAGHALYEREIGKYVFNRHPHLQNLGYGGGGGTLFKREPAIESIDAYFKREDYDRWQAMMRYVASDMWLSTIFMACGYQYGPNVDLVEANRDPDWEASGRPFVHQPPREFLLRKSL